MALREIFARFTTKFSTTSLQRGETQVKALTGKLNAGLDSLRTMGQAFAGLVVVQYVRQWIGSVHTLVTELMSVGRELDLNARRLGVQASTLQALGLAAQSAGQDMDTMVDAVSTLQERMRDAVQDPRSDPAVQLRALGVVIPRTIAEMPDAITLLARVSDGMAGLSNQTDRVGASMTLFGDVGRELLPVLQQGSGFIDQYREALADAGGGVSQDMIEASRDMALVMARLDISMISLKSQMITALLPTITKMIDAFASFTAWLARNRVAIALLKVAFWTLFTAIAAIVTLLVVGTAPAWILLLLVLGAVALVIGAVVLVLQDMYVWFTGGESIIGSFVDALLALGGTSLAEIRGEIEGVFDTLRDGYNTIAGALGLPTIGISTDTIDTTDPGAKSEGVSRAAQVAAADAEVTFGRRVLNTVQETGAAGSSEGAFARLLGRRGNQRQADPRAQLGAGLSPADLALGPANITQTTTVNVTGAGDPAEIGEAVRRAMDRTNRDAVEALGQ